MPGPDEPLLTDLYYLSLVLFAWQRVSDGMPGPTRSHLTVLSLMLVLLPNSK